MLHIIEKPFLCIKVGCCPSMNVCVAFFMVSVKFRYSFLPVYLPEFYVTFSSVLAV